jgi:peptidoglycan/LPS O-acetylase OafA/YrhL
MVKPRSSTFRTLPRQQLSGQQIRGLAFAILRLLLVVPLLLAALLAYAIAWLLEARGDHRAGLPGDGFFSPLELPRHQLPAQQPPGARSTNPRTH